MGVAWLFPGQGSQAVGMGRDLAGRYPRAARVFEEANDVLGIDLRALCFDGPQGDLDRTANTQPALLATAIASLRAAEDAAEGLAGPKVVMGHSLGEFTGLVAAGGPTPPGALRGLRTPGGGLPNAPPPGAGAAGGGLAGYAGARGPL